MAKVYILIFVIGILGVIGYGAKYYYDTTQNRIAVLTKNNATLKAAVETSESSIAELKSNIKKMGALNNKLQKDLQKAENYGDELRAKLNKLNLVVEALKDSKNLEGRMNGATAEIWRGIMEESGNTNKYDLPEWLQRSDPGSGNKNSNQNRTSNSTDSSKTETTPVK
jgi:chromosome segregation ATPase